MAVTKKAFQGQVPKGLAEERQHFQPDDQFGPSEGTAELLKGMVGADAMNSPAAKGLPGSGSEPQGPVPGSERGPRRAGSAQPVSEGNDSSTGAAGPFPATASGQHNAQSTGAGEGSKTVKTYGPGGPATGVGGIKD